MKKRRKFANQPPRPGGVRIKCGTREKAMMIFAHGAVTELKAALKIWEIDQDYPWMALTRRQSIELEYKRYNQLHSVNGIK